MSVWGGASRPKGETETDDSRPRCVRTNILCVR